MKKFICIILLSAILPQMGHAEDNSSNAYYEGGSLFHYYPSHDDEPTPSEAPATPQLSMVDNLPKLNVSAIVTFDSSNSAFHLPDGATVPTGTILSNKEFNIAYSHPLLAEDNIYYQLRDPVDPSKEIQGVCSVPLFVRENKGVRLHITAQGCQGEVY